MRSAASPHTGNRLTVTSRGSSPATASIELEPHPLVIERHVPGQVAVAGPPRAGDGVERASTTSPRGNQSSGAASAWSTRIAASVSATSTSSTEAVAR